MRFYYDYDESAHIYFIESGSGLFDRAGVLVILMRDYDSNIV